MRSLAFLRACVMYTLDIFFSSIAGSIWAYTFLKFRLMKDNRATSNKWQAIRNERSIAVKIHFEISSLKGKDVPLDDDVL